jgi:pyrimidine deaminase RibD-like protein
MLSVGNMTKDSVDAAKMEIAALLQSDPLVEADLFWQLKKQRYTQIEIAAALSQMTDDRLIAVEEEPADHYPSPLDQLPEGVFLTPLPKSERLTTGRRVVRPLQGLQAWWKGRVAAIGGAEIRRQQNEQAGERNNQGVIGIVVEVEPDNKGTELGDGGKSDGATRRSEGENHRLTALSLTERRHLADELRSATAYATNIAELVSTIKGKIDGGEPGDVILSDAGYLRPMTSWLTQVNECLTLLRSEMPGERFAAIHESLRIAKLVEESAKSKFATFEVPDTADLRVKLEHERDRLTLVILAKSVPTRVQREREFMELAIAEARKCVGEDGRSHPKVGAVVVKDGTLLASAHRGELGEGEHAEFTALERKLADEIVAGATVYATLEPCTTRNHPKVPCANRLIERKVERVVIGMLDPNPAICGKGERFLREHGIVVDRFPNELIIQLEELNRDFTRAQRQVTPPSSVLISAIDQLVEFVRERAGESWPPAPPLNQDAEHRLRELDSQVYALTANTGLSIPDISMPVDPLTQLVNCLVPWGLTKIPSTRRPDGLRVYPLDNWIQAMNGLRAAAAK